MQKVSLLLTLSLGLIGISSAQQDWKVLKFGSFSVKTPVAMVPFKLPSQVEGKMKVWKVSANSVSYIVTLTNLEAKDMDTPQASAEAQQAFLDTVTNGDYAPFTKQQEEVFKGWSELSVKLKQQDHQTEIHSYVVGKSLVSIGASYAFEDDRLKSVDPFFDSFEIDPSVPNGKLKEALPVWQTVKESGFTFAVPGTPVGPDKDAKGRLQTHCTHLTGFYSCVTAQVPDAVMKELPAHDAEIRNMVVADMANTLGVATCTPTLGKLGTDKATWADMLLGDGRAARQVVVFHGSTMVSMLYVGPKALRDGEEPAQFFKSLQFSK